MKKCMLVLGLMMLMPFYGADAAYYNNYNGANRSYYNNNGIRRTGYNQSNSYRSSSRQVYSGNSYARSNSYAASGERTTTVKETQSHSSQMRKYFLAHPFFQPLKGKIGSVTDVSYSHNSFDFDLLNGVVLDIDRNSGTYNQVLGLGAVGISAKQATTQIAIKEDFSFGLTDSLAVIGMVQYDKTDIEFKDWSTGDAGDKYSSSGLNLFGIGLQGRFVDNNDWIGVLKGSFLHQNDVANAFVAEFDGGFKVGRTTVYGLVRGWYLNLTEGNAYGAYVEDNTNDWLLLSYNTDAKNIFYVEGGIGLWAVLNKYFTLNGEITYGNYDWHNQMNIKGAIGWQPGDMFALNLYASTEIYDSAKGQTKQYMNYDNNPVGYPTTLVYTTGDYNIKNYDEWKIGLQLTMQF